MTSIAATRRHVEPPGDCDTDRLLADAGLVFASSLRWENVVDGVGRLAAACFGGCAGVRLPDLDGGVHERVLPSAVCPPERAAAVLARVHQRYSGELERVHASGDPRLLASVPPDGVSGMIVPLRSPDHAHGTLSLVSTTRHLDPVDLAAAVELGRRTGLALDREQRRLQRLSWGMAWTEDLAAVAHDLRSPLGVVGLTAGLLQERWSADAEAGHWLGRIQTAVQRMEQMIGEVLESIRTETAGPRLHLRPIHPGSVVREVIEENQSSADRKGVMLAARVSPSVPPVLADFEALVRALSNVCSNSVKHSPAGAGVLLEVDAAAPWVRFRVRDEGPGIDPDDAPFIFERYWRAPDQAQAGIGLGLHIARSLVEAHGGRIGLEAETESGSTFFILVPATPASGETARASKRRRLRHP